MNLINDDKIPMPDFRQKLSDVSGTAELACNAEMESDFSAVPLLHFCMQALQKGGFSGACRSIQEDMFEDWFMIDLLLSRRQDICTISRVEVYDLRWLVFVNFSQDSGDEPSDEDGSNCEFHGCSFLG